MSAEPLALARHHLSTGSPERALEALQGLGEHAALGRQALLLRGRALLALDRDDEALHVARRGLVDDADDVDLWSLLADASTAVGDLVGAERALLAALRLRPSDADLMADYAEVLARAGQDEKAERVLARAAELDPQSGQVAVARAYLSFLRGDDRRAARDARAALAQDPDSVAAQAVLGGSALNTGDARTGLRASRRAAMAALGNAELAELAREARILAHPTMLGMRLVSRVGQAQLWILGILIVFGARAALPAVPALVVVLTWLAFVIYTWTALPLLRLWARWRW